jgi:hypothetical protein
MLDTMHRVKTEYEPRIRALLERWRAACLERAWPTTDIKDGFERLPTGHPVHEWSFDAKPGHSRVAHVSITLETETDPADDDGFVTVLHCFSSVSFGLTGSDYVKWEAPKVSEYLGDDQAIRSQFALLERIDGKQLADTINQRTVN